MEESVGPVELVIVELSMPVEFIGLLATVWLIKASTNNTSNIDNLDAILICDPPMRQ